MVAFVFSNQIYYFLVSAIPEEIDQRIGSLIEPFYIKVKLGFFCGIFFTLPFLTYQAYGFIKPALKLKEEKTVRLFVILFFILLCIALSFTYYLLPFLIKALLSFAPQGVLKQADSADYISTILSIYLGFSIIFQGPLLIFLTIYQGFVSVDFYTDNRKWVVVILAILCAVFSPPDLMSMVFLFIPLYALFELSILFGKLMTRDVRP